MRSVFLVLLAAMVCSSAAASQTTPFTVDDVVKQETASGFSLSRDGTRVLWIKTTADEEKDGTIATLMLSDPITLEHRALTVGKAGVSSPKFSPGGQLIAFLSSRKPPEGTKPLPKDEEGPQIWLLDLRGGEPSPLTHIPHGVKGFAWHDDATLFLTARERKTLREQEADEDKDKTIVVEDKQDFTDGAVRLYRFTLKGKKLERITENRDRISSFAVSPDGQWVVANHDQSPSYTAEKDVPPKCMIHRIDDGAAREIFVDNKSKPGGFAWRHDSAGFYALKPHATVDGEDEGGITLVFEVSVPTVAVSQVPLDWQWGATQPFVVTNDGFLSGLCGGVRPRIGRFTRTDSGWRRELIWSPDGKTIHSFTLARDAARAVYITGGASDPDHVMTAELSGASLKDPKEFYRPNDGFKTKQIAKTEVIRWVGAEDHPIEGLLYYPNDYEKGKRHPLILITHGGPHGADTDRFLERWANSPNLYTQRGAFVLKTNYHGSSDYGLAFGESIKKRYYELEVIDMFSGIKKLVDDGLADPEQLGVIGWSNGAILSIAAVAMAKEFAPGFDYTFKVCAPGAGDVNWSSDYGNCAFGAAFDDYYLGGSPWKLPDVYQKKSPLFYAENVTTPTIIFFGSEDTSVPTEQGWQWYRALNMIGKAPVRYLLFPGEGHGLKKLTHQKRKLVEELAWVDRHLFLTVSKGEVEPKKDSPLAQALAAVQYARVGSRVGESVAGILVPETVAMGKTRVGRFEVTRAQWQEFDSALSVSPADENHPITNIRTEVKDYLEWLNVTTGRTYRLLTEEEWKSLPSGKEENTFERWIGYAAPPWETEALTRNLLSLGWRTVLKPVGSHPGARRDESGPLIHDVGGNAAEWVTDKDGKLVARGKTAGFPSDPLAKETPPPARFIGLRIALDR